MGEFFMGQELIQGELPANSAKPAETPPEGVIMTDTSMDGWQRRYIYIAMSGSAPEEILISETPPSQKQRISGTAVAVEEAPAEMEGVGRDIPEGIVMPEGAVLPENAVFSGMPSAPTPMMSGRAAAPVMAPVSTPSLRTAVPMQSQQITAAVTMVARPNPLGQAQPQQQQPIRMNSMAQSPVSVPTVSIQKAAPPPPLSVQTPQSPVPGGQVSLPFVQRPVERTPEVSGNMRLTNAIDSIKPVSVAPIADMNRASQERPAPVLGQRSIPLTTQEGKKDLYQVSNPIAQNAPIAAGLSQMGGSSRFAQHEVPLRHLGQAAPAAPAQGAAPAAPSTGGKCPGAVEMPDGRVIEPGDSVSLKDLCELIPFLVETLTDLQAKGLSPGQKVPVVGQQANGQMAVPTQGGAFGPAGQGPYGRSTGGWVGGGGGGPGPTGSTGPAGPMGATGPGSIVEPPVVKVDGDFVAGPGAFVPVPGTTVLFPMSAAGVAEVKAIVTLGSALTMFCESVQIGVRIDGTDYPLTVRLISTSVPGVDEFLIGQCFSFPITLAAGAHIADLLIRGLLPGEFGAGLGSPAAVSANPSIPLIMTVSHS